MGYRVFIGDRSYSSWSMRVGLALDRAGIEAEVVEVDFAAGPVAGQMPEAAPARTVPALALPDGTVVWESMAVLETLAERHPEARLWPETGRDRAVARSLAAEMHAGFAALRAECPMNLRTAYAGVTPSEAVRADVDRIETLWAHARGTAGVSGPWLFGAWSLADAVFAPVAARIAGYGLGVGRDAADYVALQLADPAFRRWRAEGLRRGATLPRYAKPFATRPWPGGD